MLQDLDREETGRYRYHLALAMFLIDVRLCRSYIRNNNYYLYWRSTMHSKDATMPSSLPDATRLVQQALSRRSLLRGAAGAFGLFLAAPGLSWADQGQQQNGQGSLSQVQELLTVALQHEHGAFVQYANHAGIMSLSLEQDVSSLYQEIIADEVGHAISLVRALQASGAEPTLAVWPARSHQDPAELLFQDVAAEENAVELYQKILELDLDSGLQNEIHLILEQEVDHLKVFSDMLESLG